jgi:meso-butanediol dehydrogenase / (S,S)-butanediol dehydrogenase / diacetyl reductase
MQPLKSRLEPNPSVWRYDSATMNSNRIVVVTGAAQGIGRACATRFAQQGDHVLIVDRNLDGASKTAAELEAVGLKVSALHCDVSSPDSVTQLVQTVIEQFGRIDVLHNNAGMLIPGTALTQRLEDWDQTFLVNVRSILLMCRAVIPQMQVQGGGIIVNTASISGMIGEANLAAYNASKGAVINFTRQLAVDYAKDGIRVNCVCPGWVDTGFNDPIFVEAGMQAEAIAEMVKIWVPMGRQAVAEDIAGSVIFLASKDAEYITGHALVVDGGLTAQ